MHPAVVAQRVEDEREARHERLACGRRGVDVLGPAAQREVEAAQRPVLEDGGDVGLGIVACALDAYDAERARLRILGGVRHERLGGLGGRFRDEAAHVEPDAQRAQRLV